MTLAYLGTAVLVGIVVWMVYTYNSFVSLRNKADEAWSGVDVQLKRRHDLVPNLVATVKGYAAHERTTLELVTKARTEAMKAASAKERERAEGSLSSLLGELHAVAEQYPDLKASENFQVLETQLSEIEDQIQAARRIYNGNVEAYNTRIQVFPNSLLAGETYEAREFFVIDAPADREVPAVSFG